MDAFLRDVHHYLFDVEFAPAGRTPVRIQQTIRERFVDGVAPSYLAAARRRLAQHGHRDRLRLPEARGRLRWVDG